MKEVCNTNRVNEKLTFDFLINVTPVFFGINSSNFLFRVSFAELKMKNYLNRITFYTGTIRASGRTLKNLLVSAPDL